MPILFDDQFEEEDQIKQLFYLLHKNSDLFFQISANCEGDLIFHNNDYKNYENNLNNNLNNNNNNNNENLNNNYENINNLNNNLIDNINENNQLNNNNNNNLNNNLNNNNENLNNKNEKENNKLISKKYFTISKTTKIEIPKKVIQSIYFPSFAYIEKEILFIKGEVKINFFLLKNYFYIGGKIFFYLEIENNTKKEIDFLFVQLKTNLVFLNDRFLDQNLPKFNSFIRLLFY